MQILVSIVAVVATIPLLAGTARADIAPSPAELQQTYRSTVVAAGHACPLPTRYRNATAEELRKNAKLGESGQIVECGNGKKFHVVLPPRRPNFIPPGQPAPPPSPPAKVTPLR